MAKQDLIDKLPQGPWLSEGEIQAILNTNSDSDFELIMAAKRRKSIVRWLWTAGVAASIVVAVMVGERALRGKPAMESLCTDAVIAAKSDSNSPIPQSKQDVAPVIANHTPSAIAPPRSRTAVITEADPSVADILREADLAFVHADRVCEGMIIAADCEFETEESYDDASVIYI